MPSIEHPYRNLTKGQWLRGNLHTHTTNSDGENKPQSVINKYAKLGHDFLAISDHDIHTSVKDLKKWNNKGMVMMPGNEISANGPHILHVASDRLVPPLMPRQEVINGINAGKGLTVIPHPNWQSEFDGTKVTQMQEWIDYDGLEIYNGLIGRLAGSPYATNKWDLLLFQGRRLWGFANDDSHIDRDIGNGWNVVYAKERSVKGIREALRAGRFYASSGVEIKRIAVRGTTITIETENARRIAAIYDCGKRFLQTDDSAFTVEMDPGMHYMRFECWGDGEQFAWTQPFWMKHG
jgi:predicted metal-dependent phosphoesterase TrpH